MKIVYVLVLLFSTSCTTRTYTVYMYGDTPQVSISVDKVETISPEVKASLK